MELLWILLSIAIIVGVSWWRTRESMTNAEVQSMMQTFGTSSESKQDTQVSKHPIRGPEVDKSQVKAADDKKNKPTKSRKADYPQIYGPDIVMPPGTNPNATGSESSYFDVNPDLNKVFPTNGAPKPYLTDFSKFQR